MMSKKRSHLVGALSFMALMCFSWSASAGGFEYLVENQKAAGNAKNPTLVLKATDFVEGGKVTISGGTKKSIKLKKMSPGKELRIPLKVPRGEHTIDVSIDVRGVSDETQNIAFTFDVARVPEITFTVDRDGVDTGKGVVPFKVNVPMDRAEIEFFDTDGTKIGSEVQNFGGESGKLEITWSPTDKLGGISIVAYDQHGFWTSVLLEPWFIEIEHEEIIFDFGKASWQASEEPKLEKSLKEIKSAMKKNAKFRPDMRLYVTGYTDTVGSASQNQKLSEQRARAIAKWFKKNGVDMPVYAQGFGEAALAVKTDDEVAEPRNRRALYVLGNGPPPQSKDIPNSRWKGVK